MYRKYVFVSSQKIVEWKKCYFLFLKNFFRKKYLLNFFIIFLFSRVFSTRKVQKMVRYWIKYTFWCILYSLSDSLCYDSVASCTSGKGGIIPNYDCVENKDRTCHWISWKHSVSEIYSSFEKYKISSSHLYLYTISIINIILSWK